MSGDSYLDVSLLFAIIMYGIFALLISELVSYLERRRDASSQRDVYEQQQAEAQRHEAEAEAAQARGAVAPGNGRPKRTTARHK